MRDDFERNKAVTDLVGLVSSRLFGRGFESRHGGIRRGMSYCEEVVKANRCMGT